MKIFFFFFNCSHWKKLVKTRLVVWCHEETNKNKSRIREAMTRTAHIIHIFSIAISDSNKSTNIVKLKPKIQKKTPSYWILQLQISKVCNETTHDKVAPTKQNLICRGKSAIEIIKMRGESQSHGLRTPGEGFFSNISQTFWLIGKISRIIWGIFCKVEKI